MKALGYAANIFGWPVLQITIGFAATRLPSRFFAQDCWLTAPRRWEQNGKLFRTWLVIRRWKSLLPDGARWFGGFAKEKIASHDSASLAQFASETRRSEMAHWCMLCCFPLFFAWNPAWACLLMTAYAIAANLPCIVVQRYNRVVLQRLSATRCRMEINR